MTMSRLNSSCDPAPSWSTCSGQLTISSNAAEMSPMNHVVSSPVRARMSWLVTVCRLPTMSPTGLSTSVLTGLPLVAYPGATFFTIPLSANGTVNARAGGTMMCLAVTICGSPVNGSVIATSSFHAVSTLA